MSVSLYPTGMSTTRLLRYSGTKKVSIDWHISLVRWILRSGGRTGSKAAVYGNEGDLVVGRP